MIPVHFSSTDQGYVAMSAGEIGALPNLPEYPVPTSVKIYETFYDNVDGVFTDSPVDENNSPNTVIHAYKEADGSMVPVIYKPGENKYEKYASDSHFYTDTGISIHNVPDWPNAPVSNVYDVSAGDIEGISQGKYIAIDDHFSELDNDYRVTGEGSVDNLSDAQIAQLNGLTPIANSTISDTVPGSVIKLDSPIAASEIRDAALDQAVLDRKGDLETAVNELATASGEVSSLQGIADNAASELAAANDAVTAAQAAVDAAEEGDDTTDLEAALAQAQGEVAAKTTAKNTADTNLQTAKDTEAAKVTAKNTADTNLQTAKDTDCLLYTSPSPRDRG